PRDITSDRSPRTSGSSRAPTARLSRDGVAGAARHGRGLRRAARSTSRARRGEEARHPHGTARRSGRRISRAGPRDGGAARGRGLGFPRPRLAARSAEGAEPLPSLEPLALEDAESEEELRARPVEYAIVRERASQLGARPRAGERPFHRAG